MLRRSLLWTVSVIHVLLTGTSTAFILPGVPSLAPTQKLQQQQQRQQQRRRRQQQPQNKKHGFAVVTSAVLLRSQADPKALEQNANDEGNGKEEEEEWHPVDPAHSTPQFLSGLWHLIARGNDMVKGESYTVMFPQMEDKFTPRYLNLVTAHLDACKDVCDYFGITTTLVPYTQQGKVKGFTVKSYRDPNKDPDSFEFDYDPFWDDGDEWNYEGVDDEFLSEQKNKFPEIVNKIPDDDDVITGTTKRWVSKMMSDMGVCPFTSGAEMAGLPMGPVYYTVDRSTSMEDMYAAYWREVVRVEQQSESDLSTTLLIGPEFCMENVELFENFSNTLTQPLTALGVEDLLQLVFFHPQWSFRDGGERGGEGAAANYARRSPWPMINILRTKQVRAAQKGIPTGLVYKQNEKTLSEIGVDKLETMLRLRDWQGIADLKVNRRDMEALRVAQDFQNTGVVKSDDTTFASDATPAANKVDEKQIENSNLSNVVREAIGKRLGKGTGAGVKRLSGPETSAAIMASDFLLQELDNIISGATDSSSTSAHKAILEDFNPAMLDDEQEDELGSVMFGRSGLMDGPQGGDGYFSSGNNPSNFY